MGEGFRVPKGHNARTWHDIGFGLYGPKNNNVGIIKIETCFRRSTKDLACAIDEADLPAQHFLADRFDLNLIFFLQMRIY